MNVNRLFVRICRIAGHHRIFYELGTKVGTKELVVNTSDYRRFGLSPVEVRAGDALVTVAMFLVSFLPLLLLLGYVSLFLSLLISYSVHRWFRGLIPRELEKEKMMISLDTPLITQEIVLASVGSGSIFDLIDLVMKGRHPFVSKAFAKIAKRVNNGEKPEQLVRQYANYQPCEGLRRSLLDAISLNLEWNSISRAIRERKGEVEFEYDKYTMQAETRIVLIAGLGTFWPIVFSISVFVNNLHRNLLLMALIAFFSVAFLVILERHLMKPVRGIAILGESEFLSRRKGLLNHTKKEELNETLSLLFVLGQLLQRERISPELAIKRVCETYDGWLKPLIADMARRIVYNGETFNESWGWLLKQLTSDQCIKIAGILPRMIQKTTEGAGERMMEVVYYVRENQSLVEDRERIIIAQRFKARILSLFSSASLGLIGALSPLFAISTTQVISLANLGSPMPNLDSLITAMILLLMTAISSLNVMKAVGSQNPWAHAGLCAAVFLAAFMISTQMLVAIA